MAVFLQRLDAVQRAEGAFGQTLDLVVIQRQQRQVLQVFEERCSDAVDPIGIQQPGGRHQHDEACRGPSERQQRRPADSQKLQRGQAVKHASGQLRDLITIQNPAAERLELHSVLMFQAPGGSRGTHGECNV